MALYRLIEHQHQHPSMSGKLNKPDRQLKEAHERLTGQKEAYHCHAYTLFARQFLLQDPSIGARLPLNQNDDRFYGHMNRCTTTFIEKHCEPFVPRSASQWAAERRCRQEEGDAPPVKDVQTLLRERVRAFLDAVDAIPAVMPTAAKECRMWMA